MDDQFHMGSSAATVALRRRRQLRQARRARWLGTFVRSALVGLGATVADVGLLALLIQVAGVTAVQANVPALLVGITLQYLGNKYFAFRDRSRDHLRQGALFVLVEIGTLVLNAGGFHLVVTRTSVPYFLARPLVTLAVYCGFSFPLWARVFRSDAMRGRAGRT